MRNAVIKKFSLASLVFLIVMGLAPQARATITNTTPTFYSDTKNGLTCTYLCFSVTNSSGSSIYDAWVTISGIALGGAAGHQEASYHLGPLQAGEKRAVYFYVSTTSDTAPNDYPTVTLYSGNPASGGTSVDSSSFTIIHAPAQQNSSSKISSVISGPNPASLGGIVTLTVSGNVGSNPKGTAGILSFTAATDNNWLPDTYELFSSVISLPDGTTLTDAPYTSNYNLYVTGNYVAVYKFISKDTTASPPSYTSPGCFIPNGGPMSHAPTGANGGGTTPPPPPIPPSTSNTVVLAKFSDKTSLPAGTASTVTYTLRLTNSGQYDVTLDTLVDALPTGIIYQTGSSKYNGVPVPDPAGASGVQLTWSGQYLVPANSYRDLTFQATLPATLATGTYTNSAVGYIGSVLIDTTLATTDSIPATSSLIISAAPVLTKSFSPAVTGLNQQSLLTLTVTNPQGSPAWSNLAFNDNLPAGLVITDAPVNTCGGALTSTASALSLAGGTIGAGTSTCTITAHVMSGTAATYVNTVTAPSGGTGGLNITQATATLQVSAATLSKAFSPSSINANQTSSVVFTIANGSGNPAQTNLNFTDTLPAGLTVTSATSQCGGTVSSSGTYPNPYTLTFTGGSISAGTTNCTVTATVQPPSGSAGTSYTNYGANISVSGNLQKAATDQTLTITSAATMQKSFSPSTVGTYVSGTSAPASFFSQLTFTLNNPGSKAQALSFTDLFPAGLVVAAPTAPAQIVSTSGACSGVTVYRPGTTLVPTGGETGIDVAATVGANGTCYVYVYVTSTTPGPYVNSSANIVNPVGVGTSSITPQTLNVVDMTLTTAFGAPAIYSGSTTSLTFTLTNTATKPQQYGFGFTDTLPAGLTVTGVSTQCGGTASYTANSVTLSGGSISASTASCTVTATVRGSASAITTFTNAATNFTGVTGNLDVSSANASLVVGSTVTLQKNVAARVNSGDQFALTVTDGTTPITATTTGSSTGLQAATATKSATGTALTLSEAASGATRLNQYASAISCTNATSNSTTVLPSGNGTSFNITPAAGDAITCTITNTPLQVTVQVQETSTNATGTFSFSGTNGVAANFTITTVTAGAPVASSIYTVASTSTNLTVTEAAPAGWPANPTSATCSDSNGTASGNGSSAFGSLSNNVLTIPSANLRAGAQIICTFANTLQVPTVQLAKTANGSGTFGFTLTNLTNANDSIAVSTPLGTAATVTSSKTSAVVSITTAVTIQESTIPSGWPVNPVTAACIDINGVSSGNGSGSFGSLSGNTLTIPASYLRSGAQIVCTFTNTAPGTGLVLVKAVDKTAAYPGDVLTYTITYSNNSLETLTNVIISDAVPTYTYNPVATCITPLPSAITGCTAVTTSNAVNWQLSGALSPNASGQVKLSVTIQQ